MQETKEKISYTVKKLSKAIEEMDKHYKEKSGLKNAEPSIDDYLTHKKQYDSFAKETKNNSKYKNYQKEINKFYKK